MSSLQIRDHIEAYYTVSRVQETMQTVLHVLAHIDFTPYSNVPGTDCHGICLHDVICSVVKGVILYM